MIENNHQLQVTKERLADFTESLKIAENELLLAQANIDSLKSQIATFNQEIAEYENPGRPRKITVL